MNSTNDVLIFDGHNDSLQILYVPEKMNKRSYFERSDQGHIDLPRMREGGFGGGFFAVFVPSHQPMEKFPGDALSDAVISYDLPPAASIDFRYAQELTMKGMASLFRLESQSNGQMKVVRSANELAACLRQGIVAVVLHFEGAEAIDSDLNSLYVFYQSGLRSLGLTWSRSNPFAQGVPFKFPHSPDTGPGLSEAGRELVKTCNRLGIMIDLSHINEQGFWDTAGITDAPLVVTHAGVHALCPSTRNLTDKQLDAVGESGGVVGVNFHVAFLRKDGHLNADTPITEITRHIDYIAERLGIDHVALGSDFDGAEMPRDLKDVAGLPRLLAALRKNGYDEEALRKIAHENWLRVLSQTWKG